MLETKDLVKIYKPKKGVRVTALDHVSIKFPETGMVFLLGKSGSGKSTLLNVLGGLDRYDSGEILIKGKSSKRFRQSHFDSYRNTYVGFIFQEYNILDAFSVGANIALALQLQGVKPTNERINEILREVDLEGYGSRKPNELSGGQKQRVAIARALVKDPKIIMADEPTGALDSNTGRQVLETLKKLSTDRLVIVVSHDREFAEQYADRIIELADGKVIRDVACATLTEEAQPPVYETDSVSLSQGYRLTDKDRDEILAYIQRMVTEGKAPKIALQSGSGGKVFRPTDPAGIPSSEGGFHLIKSKLPMRYAFKMGASGLKHKKFRLVMTILLSCMAFVMFGLADTMASYDYVTTAVASLSDPDSPITYAALEKKYDIRIPANSGSGMIEVPRNAKVLTDEDFARLREEAGLPAVPVLTDHSMEQMDYWDVRFGVPVPDPEDPDVPSGVIEFAGCVEITDSLLTDMNARLVAGELPQPGTNQLAISTVKLEGFRELGYIGEDGATIQTAEDMLGRKLTMGGMEYTVTGVVDPGIDYTRYEILNEPQPTIDKNMMKLLQRELEYDMAYSLSGLAMVAPGQIQKIIRFAQLNRSVLSGASLTSVEPGVFQFEIGWSYGEYEAYEIDGDISDVVWLDGVPRTQLAEGEVVLREIAYEDALKSYDHSDPRLDFWWQYTSENPDYSEIFNLPLELRCEAFGAVPVRIVGMIPTEVQAPDIILSGALLDRIPQEEPVFSQAIAGMPKDPEAIRRLVECTNKEYPAESNVVYRVELQNPVTLELRHLDGILQGVRKVFLGAGILFAVFASLLFSNFIATSISYQKREIGILRAIGSRSNDVFRIFFAESFLIAMINFLLSLGGTVGICALINDTVRSNVGLRLTLLNMGVRQVALLFGISLLVAIAASFLPVRKIAAKRPIDAIRDR